MFRAQQTRGYTLGCCEKKEPKEGRKERERQRIKKEGRCTGDDLAESEKELWFSLLDNDDCLLGPFLFVVNKVFFAHVK